MTDPYQFKDTTAENPERRSVWRGIAAAPFILFGGIWCLMLVRTPASLIEAWSRTSSAGWGNVVGDAAFAESLWRSTVLPFTGVGLLSIGIGILARRKRFWIFGLVWSVLVFSAGSYCLR